jgi:hypothetical protein
MKYAILTAALTLALSGCATVTDPTTGQTRQELTPAGQTVLGIALLGVAVGLAAAAGGSDSPDRTYVTTYSDGTQTKTEVYDR